MSLGLAGYLMGRDEKCVEVLHDSTWVIPSKDRVNLRFDAANVIELFDNNEAHRLFVQGGSKNIDANILASFLSDLKLLVIDYREALIIPNLSLLSCIFKLNTLDETKLNFCAFFENSKISFGLFYLL